MDWPNHSSWAAERDQWVVVTSEGKRFVWRVDCGSLFLPSGRLVVCDPFAFMEPEGNPHVVVPRGRYPVTVTMADVSDDLTGSHIREAYATVRFLPDQEVVRRPIPLLRKGDPVPEIADGEFVGFPVDAGTACFVDEESVRNCMPDSATWLKDLFENDRPDSWFNLMDDPAHIREGIANIELPLAQQGENILIVHSGWGDGVYPVIGSYDPQDRLVAVHIDFGVVP